MIDVHLHLLPGVDDGPPHVADSLALARALVEAGVSQAVVTPHIDDWTRHVVPDAAAVAIRTASLQAALTEQAISLDLISGGECYFAPELADRLKAGQLPTWGESPCVLVELAASQHVHHLGLMLAQLQRAGARVILAHPERYAFVRAQPDALDEFVEDGLLLQLTASSFRSGSRSAVSEALLKRGIVHLVASDAHNAGAVAGMLEGLARFEDLAGAAMRRLVTEENPAALLTGLGKVTPAQAEVRRARRWMPFARMRG